MEAAFYGSVRRDKRKELGGRRDDDEEDLTNEEIERQLKKLRSKKVARPDGIRNEAWKFCRGQVRERLREVIKEVWRDKGWPESWKEGVISPLHKKGDKQFPANYRGITLLSTAYKIYAAVLAERLMREAVKKQILPETQASFRKGKGMDKREKGWITSSS